MHSIIFLDLIDTLVEIPQKPKHLVFKLLGFTTIDEFDEFVEDLTIQSPGLTQKQFFERISLTKPQLQQRDIITARQRWAKCLETVKFYDDAIPTLKLLRSNGARLAVISNTLPPTHALIDRLGLYRYVDHVFLSCDIGAWKPNRQIFLSALRRMSAEPSETAMVGNKITTDIVGAIDSGIQPILLRQNGHVEPEIIVQGHLVPVASSLRAVPCILNALEKGSVSQTRARRGHE